MAEQVWSYIGRTKRATEHQAENEVVSCIVDCPATQKELIRTLPEWLRDGLNIERVPVEWVRKHFGTTEPWP